MYLRLPYIRVLTDGVLIGKVLVDNGAAANIIPTRMLSMFGKTFEDLLLTDVLVTGFVGQTSRTRGILPLMMSIGGVFYLTSFFMVDGVISYNMLLGRDFIHANKAVPSSLPRC